MKNEKEETDGVPSIERFRHFKGIQLEGEYFCCDFYEVVHRDSSITYRITADSKHRKLMTEMYHEDDIWKSANAAIPEELQQLLHQEIINTFYEKQEAPPELDTEPAKKQTLLSRLIAYLLRKLHP